MTTTGTIKTTVCFRDLKKKKQSFETICEREEEGGEGKGEGKEKREEEKKGKSEKKIFSIDFFFF